MKHPIWIVAGGTGGHLWPAIAFGRWLEQQRHSWSPLFLTGSRPLEKEIFQAANLQGEVLPLEGSPRGKTGRAYWQRWFDIFHAWRRCRILLRQNRPGGAVLFGGYVSLPALLACLEAHVPIVMHEQNARAGQVTRLASRFGISVASGWPRCDPFRQGMFHCVGIPVRAVSRLPILDAWNKLAPGVRWPEGPKVLVLGGSLGSDSLKQYALELARSSSLRNWFFLFLGGSDTGNIPPNSLMLPRRWDMESVFSVADVVITRGGGSTLAELLAWGIPAAVVPWQGATDAHQEYNAAAFVELGGGQMATEGWPLSDFERMLLCLFNEKSHREKNTDNFSCEALWQELVAVATTKGDAFHNGRG